MLESEGPLPASYSATPEHPTVGNHPDRLRNDALYLGATGTLPQLSLTFDWAVSNFLFHLALVLF